MKKSAHTPKRWHYNKHTNLIWADIEIEGQNPVVCQVSQHLKKIEEKEANARLISAAPELLKSCKELANILNSYAHRIQNGPEVIGRALAAIKKAGGVEPEQEPDDENKEWEADQNWASQPTEYDPS